MEDETGILRADAWSGEFVSGPVDDKTLQWGGRRNVAKLVQSLVPNQDLNDWKDPAIGWGVILPDRDDVPPKDKAVGADAPKPIRDLIEARGHAPVLRYRPDLPDGKLRRYAANGTAMDLNPRGKRGTADKAVPWYLLIVGTPLEIPWSLQYRLNTDACVGRLDLDPPGLENYVRALLDEWGGAQRNFKKPVIWSVDHGHPDITRLMRKLVAEEMYSKLAKDADLDVGEAFLSDAQATHATLRGALAARNPALVVTTSHGATFPLAQPQVMAGNLGLLMDRDHVPADAAALAKDWNPLGAIWYAHACCSAGCDTASQFEGLVDPTTTLGRTLTALGQTGARTAPLPRALLGGPNPLGAFIGHVEPTFDWPLRDPTNSQATVQHIIDTLYYQLHEAKRPPVGRAMHDKYYESVGGFLQDYADAINAVDRHEKGADKRAARSKLMAFDIQSMVILGDPTVRLPLPT